MRSLGLFINHAILFISHGNADVVYSFVFANRLARGRNENEKRNDLRRKRTVSSELICRLWFGSRGERSLLRRDLNKSITIDK